MNIRRPLKARGEVADSGCRGCRQVRLFKPQIRGPVGIVNSEPRPERFRDAVSARKGLTYSLSKVKRMRLRLAGGRELPWFC